MKFSAVTAAGKTLLSSEAIVSLWMMQWNYVSIIQIFYLGQETFVILASVHTDKITAYQFIYEELV